MPFLCLVLLVFKRECLPKQSVLSHHCWGMVRTGNVSFLFTGISMKRSRIHIWTWSDDEILDSMPETTMGWEVGGKRWVHFRCGIGVNYCSKEGQTGKLLAKMAQPSLSFLYECPIAMWISCPFYQMQSPFCHHLIQAGLGTCFGPWNAIDGECDCRAWVKRSCVWGSLLLSSNPGPSVNRNSSWLSGGWDEMEKKPQVTGITNCQVVGGAVLDHPLLKTLWSTATSWVILNKTSRTSSRVQTKFFTHRIISKQQ